MNIYRASARASVARNLKRTTSSNILANGVASVARNFAWALPKQKGTINSNFSASAVALVARNFAWALPKQKGTIV